MAVNKVDLNGETVLDLTGDTVTPEALNKGVTAHNAAGERITGTQVPVRTVNNIDPDTNGNVALTGGDIPYTAAGSTTVKLEIDGRQMDTKKLNAETEIADGDAFPFYDASEGINRKTLWSNIVAKLKNLFLPLAGGTMTGAITIQGTNGAVVAESPTGKDTGYRAKNTTTGKSVFFGVGSSGNNHGIYSDTAGKWLIYNDGTTTHVDNTLPLTGGTATGNIIVQKSSDAYVKVVNTDNNYSCFIDVWGSDAGVYIGHKNKWLIYTNGTNTYVDGELYHKIYSGTSAPASGTGANGDIYVKY